jgi:Mg2+ and Co2+ transporter CorA
VDMKEIYPMIIFGEDISQNEAKKIFDLQNDQLLTQVSSDDLTIFYGKEVEVINTQKTDTNKMFDSFIINLVFTRSYSELLKRYLTAHRSVWTDISLIKESRELRYRDFPATRNKILNFLKTISFIQTRLQQMSEIISARNAFVSKTEKQKLSDLGLESFDVLKSSSLYFLNLWQMTGDYANSTLTLFESLVEENTQREIRMLQQVTIAGMIVGFFGMNIAFPWEERWPSIFISSFVVIGAIILAMIIFYQVFKKIIDNRRFNISSQNKENP